MSLKTFSKEELKQKSMLELASIILKDAKKAITFKEIYDQIAELKGFTKQEKEEKIAQFYTEMNVDGRFMTIGSNIWGLKEWYPVDQADEEVAPAPKKKKKKKADDFDEDEDELEYDDVELVELGEEEEEELEVIDGFDDEDVFDEDVDDVDDDDEDEEDVLEVEIDLDEDDEEEKI